MNQPPTRLFILGDSISMQYGPYLKQYLPDSFIYGRKGQSFDGPPLINDTDMAANGGDSALVLAYLQEQLGNDFSTDILLLNCGLHDLRTDPASGEKQVPLDQYEANLQAILKLAQSAGMHVIWVRTTPVDDARHNRLSTDFHRFDADVEAYNAAADAIMAAAGCPIIDLCTFTRQLDGGLYVDHVHFRDAIRRLQGAFIAGYLLALPVPEPAV